MKIYEFVGKQLFKEHGVKIPEGYLVTSKDELTIKFLPAVLKSQVLVGGRMKAGGILFANNQREFYDYGNILLKKNIKGEKPYGILIEKMINIKREYYLSMYIDKLEKDFMILFSEYGGINIEENADKVIKINFDKYKVLPKKFHKIILTLYKLMKEKDLTLIEINPLAETLNGDLIALDAVLHLDDNSIFRQKWAKQFSSETQPFHFVKLNGDIGIIGCGAGIVMATMDAVTFYGGKPANFLDLGGGADTKTTTLALEYLKNLSINKIIMNIFGGITKCDEIAQAIVRFKQKNPQISLYVRLTGTNEEIAKQILKKYNIELFSDMYEMIECAVKEEKK
ncbi:succinyl-CoA synthetase [Thermosipho melanesiensis]|uniref:Succinate--CoA ligase (ADP-forming) n=2 Tax=Thermosipho melanesiensis TaxID=46541 RepID=A6LP53_THEM4|nr:ATP-grasp domain-containing protein [Thermosipho melanesiensis]ABR31704.1 Succinate--CoA ligase (ADP-forming) [Thermosipho melanesiensis BI429]APT74727.1 succinyl-CoA synthetase subunit beta [Thermosipho melanesiensis]OOC35228.1 succinyl-CoA synthetase [Thermosipho melanesiensis]OOC35438.1 succinyl-CoA synthetase [Thermosipho melanesiensis]OOC36689.1 succinyl-CoA synthetase [Thermosipho melanesiensis]